MNSASTTQSVGSQLGLFDAIKDLLLVHPVFLLGLIIICIMLIICFKRDRTNRTIFKLKISIASLALYYYLCVILTNIVGLPCLSEFIRLAGLGESFFDPNINLIPFGDGFSLSFLLNIMLFIPLGFLCPLISKYYQHIKNIFFIGCGLSLTIEILQLFTLYRATDIDDLITNTVGTLIGYFCFLVIHKLVTSRLDFKRDYKEPYYMKYLPVIIIVMTLVLGFIR